MINEILRGGDRTAIEGGDPARERIDEAVEFGVRKCAVDISVSFGGIAVEVVRAEHDFKCAAAADNKGQAFRTAAAGMYSHADFGLTQQRVFARRKAHIAGEDEFAARAPDAARIFAMLTTGDLVRRTKVSIRIGSRKRPTDVVMFPGFPVKSKWAR